MEKALLPKIKIFVSYSHKDAGYLADDSLLGFLKGLESENVDFWSDSGLMIGDKWDEEIKDQLRQTDIALILVSQWFLDSPYCINTEVGGFLKGCHERGLVVFPIILSACEWQEHEWLKSHQLLPGGDETIEEHYSDPGRRKRLFLRIRHDLRKQIDRIRHSRASFSTVTTVYQPPSIPLVQRDSTDQGFVAPYHRGTVQRKICLLGAFAVGKTSLVARFVHSIYTDQYHTTVGVKVDKKSIDVGAYEVQLIVWDLAGEDESQRFSMSYLRGAAGYLLVVDGTRRETIDIALKLQQQVTDANGPIPFVPIVNKADLINEWEIDDERLTELAQHGWPVIRCSAKTGQGVEEAFLTLTKKILKA